MMTEPNKFFTREYFLSELINFRQQFGTKEFWKGNRPGKSYHALLYCYVNTESLTDGDMALFEATSVEYDMRLALCISNGIYTPEVK
jgi:hypothetical protein